MKETANMEIDINHPVIEEIRLRNGGENTPGSKLVIVAEGGAMAGSVIAGMFDQLSRVADPDIFDEIIGVSAGALTAAKFIEGKSGEGLYIYRNLLIQNGFISLGRAAAPWLEPPINTSLIINDIFDSNESGSLDWDQVIESEKLRIVTGDTSLVHTYNKGIRVFEPARNKKELKDRLRASAHIPILAGKQAVIDGVVHFDGSVVAPLPIEQAINLGATHILALTARQLGTWRHEQTPMLRIVSFIFEKQFPGSTEVVKQSMATNEGMEQRLILERRNPGEYPPFILTLDIDAEARPGAITKNIDDVEIGIQAGMKAVKSVIS